MKKKIYKLLALGLSVAMTFGNMPVMAAGVDDADTTEVFATTDGADEEVSLLGIAEVGTNSGADKKGELTINSINKLSDGPSREVSTLGNGHNDVSYIILSNGYGTFSTCFGEEIDASETFVEVKKNVDLDKAVLLTVANAHGNVFDYPDYVPSYSGQIRCYVFFQYYLWYVLNNGNPPSYDNDEYVADLIATGVFESKEDLRNLFDIADVYYGYFKYGVHDRLNITTLYKTVTPRYFVSTTDASHTLLTFDLSYEETPSTLNWEVDNNGCLYVSGSAEDFFDENGKILWADKAKSIKTCVVDVDGVSDFTHAFSNLPYLTSIDITGLDTSSAFSMQYMFADDTSLVEIKGLDTMDTSSCVDMDSMFLNCKAMKGIDVSNFDVSKVSFFYDMFNGCKGIKTLDLSHWNTESAITFSGMFEGCTGLESLDLSNFNTSNVFSMACMFRKCTALKELNVSGFDTSKVVNVSSMFNSCMSLKELDLSSFDLSALDYTDDEVIDTTTGKPDTAKTMFSGAMNLERIKTPINLKYDDVALPDVSTNFKEWVIAENNGKIKVLPTNMTESIELKTVASGSASVIKKEVKVHFIVEGQEPIEKVYESGSELALTKLPIPVKENMTFDAWYTEPNGKGEKLKSGSKFSVTGTNELTFYAHFSENQYSIAFNKNGGVASKELFPKTRKVDYSEVTTLPGIAGETKYENVGINDAFVYKKGYILSGWNTKANGSGTHFDLGTDVNKLLAKKNGTITLYAEWTLIEYDITYVLNDTEECVAVNSIKNPAAFSVKKAVSLKNPTRAGYTFLGWYKDEECTVRVKSLNKNALADTILYAKWSENSYTISVNANSGKFAPSFLEKYPKKSVTLKYTDTWETPDIADVTRNGYRLVEFNTKKNGTGISFAVGDAEGNRVVEKLVSKNKGKITLYARWEKIQ